MSNSACKTLAENGAVSKLSKSIAIDYFYISELVGQGEYKMVKVDTNDNLADIMTKALGRVKFEKFASELVKNKP